MREPDRGTGWSKGKSPKIAGSWEIGKTNGRLRQKAGGDGARQHGKGGKEKKGEEGGKERRKDRYKRTQGKKRKKTKEISHTKGESRGGS